MVVYALCSVLAAAVMMTQALVPAVSSGVVHRARTTKPVVTAGDSEELDYSFIELKARLHAPDDKELVPQQSKAEVAPAPKPLAVDDKTQIHGKIKLNGQNFKTDCDCKEVGVSGKDMRFSNDDPCVTPPSKFRVRQEAFNRKMGLSASQLKALLGRPQDAVYVKIDDS